MMRFDESHLRPVSRQPSELNPEKFTHRRTFLSADVANQVQRWSKTDYEAE